MQPKTNPLHWNQVARFDHFIRDFYDLDGRIEPYERDWKREQYLQKRKSTRFNDIRVFARRSKILLQRGALFNMTSITYILQHQDKFSLRRSKQYFLDNHRYSLRTKCFNRNNKYDFHGHVLRPSHPSMSNFIIDLNAVGLFSILCGWKILLFWYASLLHQFSTCQWALFLLSFRSVWKLILRSESFFFPWFFFR